MAAKQLSNLNWQKSWSLMVLNWTKWVTLLASSALSHVFILYCHIDFCVIFLILPLFWLILRQINLYLFDNLSKSCTRIKSKPSLASNVSFKILHFHHFQKPGLAPSPTLDRINAERRWWRRRRKGVGSWTAAVHVAMHKLSREEHTETLGQCSLAGGLCQYWLSTTGSPFCFWNLAGIGIYDGTAPQGICVING